MYSQPIPSPIAVPPIVTHAKVRDASVEENVPVTMAATEKR